MISADLALQRLKEGNQRFLSGTSGQFSEGHLLRLPELAEGQHPFAIILGCSDSRVPPELIFDQGLGDLFIVRVAGNIPEPAAIGSIEYAAEHLGTRLVVVLGHSQCGAVIAALNQLEQPGQKVSRYLNAVLDHIEPSLHDLPHAGDVQRAGLLEHAIRANIQSTIDHLQSDSPVIKHLIRSDGLQVVGAEYLLDTGVVEFFE